MAGGLRDSSLTRVQPFFETLFQRDASGRGWLPQLLASAPSGRAVLGDLVDEPGSLVMTLAQRGLSGRLGCFEYPAAPPRALLAWYIDHPEALVWPAAAELSALTTRLRRTLLYDDPPGSRVKAQERAQELLVTRSSLSREWWRFEGVTMLDCLLMTDRLVVTVEGKRTEPLSATTDWYPHRSQLVRNLEAAKLIADGRPWGSLLLSEEPLDATAVLDRLELSAPHLTPNERDELRAGYLGNLTWRQACDAVGITFGSLPDTTGDADRAAR